MRVVKKPISAKMTEKSQPRPGRIGGRNRFRPEEGGNVISRALAFAIVVTVAALIPAACSTTYQVSTESELQRAVDSAVNGDQIVLEPGHYSGGINISRSITLQGREGAVIDARNCQFGLALHANGSRISGITIENTSGAGAEIAASGCVISNCQVTDGHWGIAVYGDGNLIAENRISRNSDGIVLREAHKNQILDNQIDENSRWDSDCGVVLIRSHQNTVKGNNLSDDGNCAIALRSSRDNMVSQNRAVASRWYGIYLTGHSDENMLLDNVVQANRVAGICLEESRDNTLQGNAIGGNGRGVLVTCDSYRNSIDDNRISESLRGIHLAFRSSRNRITNNTITENEFGVYLDLSSSANLVVGNNLYDNVYNAFDSGHGNAWDDGQKGNRYGDLGEVYHISGGLSKDRFPSA